MQAVILAAGEGSRMRPLTYSRPKVMLPIANKPLSEHLVIEASQAGIQEFIFVVGYKENKVKEHFGTGKKWGIKISYVLQAERMGTADAVRMTESLVGDKFLVMNGDVLTGKDDILRLALCDDTTMAVKEVEDTAGLGVVEVDGEKIVGIYEKAENPPSKLANAGIYVLTKDIFPVIADTPKSSRGEYELTQSLEIMIRHSRPVLHQKLKNWLDISYPWDLLAVNEALLADLTSSNDGIVEENVIISGPCAIGKNTRVRSGSYIVGPVIIGDNCDIGPNCFIRPASSIGNNCHVGAAVEIKNSIIMRGTKIPHHNYVGDSIIGENCNLGAGTKIANLRLDKKEIWVGSINTGRRKLGAIIGDGVETGINSCINVGTVIGDNTMIGPGVIASGVIEPNSRIF
jgi:bifunctional UDP-N-acetylglucosamine pyrophosphorylase/glucosamine-1-phosphate N-acetyltransferase